jgi:hypothetical protein
MKDINKHYIDLLYTKYKRLMITKKELSHELGISERTLTTRIAQNRGIPRYHKGNGQNGKVTFSIIDVANFMSNSIAINDLCPW